MAGKTHANGLPKVENIEVDVKHPKRRLWIVVILLAIGLGMFAYGIISGVSKQSGWMEIPFNGTGTENSAGELTFRYYLSPGSATAEYRRVTLLYTQATQDTYKLFHSTQTFDEVGNVCSINEGVNQIVTVEPALYQALKRVEESGSRLLYLGPVYAWYDTIFRSVEDTELEEFDPYTNPAAADYVRQLAAFAADPEAVSLELLGENQVRLNVSEEYLAFAEENGARTFLDFYWMKNAFILDYIADLLEQSGMTHGYLTSSDGCARCLDERGESYTVNLYDRDGDHVEVYEATYTGPMALAFFRDYPLYSDLGDYYYILENGDIRTAYIGFDGLDHASIHDLTLYSDQCGCADLLLAGAPIYIAEDFDDAAVEALTEHGIDAVYNAGDGLTCSDPARLNIAE